MHEPQFRKLSKMLLGLRTGLTEQDFTDTQLSWLWNAFAEITDDIRARFKSPEDTPIASNQWK